MCETGKIIWLRQVRSEGNLRRLININEIKVRRVSCWICTGISERSRYSLALTLANVQQEAERKREKRKEICSKLKRKRKCCCWIFKLRLLWLMKSIKLYIYYICSFKIPYAKRKNLKQILLINYNALSQHQHHS